MQFKDIPLPPTSNHQYITFFNKRTKRVQRVKSKEAVNYQNEFDLYVSEHLQAFKQAQALFKDQPLCVHCEFHFEKSRLVTKKGTFKKLDVSNRLKALHDLLAKALAIDDSAFVRVSAEKGCTEEDETEGVTVNISVCEFH